MVHICSKSLGLHDSAKALLSYIAINISCDMALLGQDVQQALVFAD